jgi:hypothetical protein
MKHIKMWESYSSEDEGDFNITGKYLDGEDFETSFHLSLGDCIDIVMKEIDELDLESLSTEYHRNGNVTNIKVDWNEVISIRR